MYVVTQWGWRNAGRTRMRTRIMPEGPFETFAEAQEYQRKLAEAYSCSEGLTTYSFGVQIHKEGVN